MFATMDGSLHVSTDNSAIKFEIQYFDTFFY
jgi:hypothetical protein